MARQGLVLIFLVCLTLAWTQTTNESEGSGNENTTAGPEETATDSETLITEPSTRPPRPPKPPRPHRPSSGSGNRPDSNGPPSENGPPFGNGRPSFGNRPRPGNSRSSNNRPSAERQPPEASLGSDETFFDDEDPILGDRIGRKRRASENEDYESDANSQQRLFCGLFGQRTSCDYATQRGFTCINCTQRLFCTRFGGFLRTCGGFTPHCNAGRCSFIQSSECASGSETTTTNAPTETTTNAAPTT